MFSGIDSVSNASEDDNLAVDNRPTDQERLNDITIRLIDLEYRLPREPTIKDVPIKLLPKDATLALVISTVNKLIQQKLTRHKI